MQKYEKGRRWAVSPVTVWELLNTTEDARREDLIYFCKNLVSDSLLPSPEELIFSYMDQGCPVQENVRELKSASDLGATWTHICRDDMQTLVVDQRDLRRRFEMLVLITRDLHRITRSRELSLERYADDAGMSVSLESAVNALSWVRAGEPVTEDQRKLYKISIFYILLMLCAEVGVDSETTRAFWKRAGIESTLHRFRYLLTHYETIVHRGPIMAMAHMTYAQTRGKFSRGVFWDSLHASYLAYVDWMLSDDADFMRFRDDVSWHPNCLKIHRCSEMELTFHSAIQR